MTTTTRAKRDPEGRKRAIVEATVELIAELGVNDVNHRKIAERAGVPLGATTQYFSSRSDLILAALQQMELEYQRDLDQLAEDLTVSDDRVLTVAEFFLGYLQDDEESRAALAFFLANLHAPEFAEMTERWNVKQQAVMEKHFGREFAQAVETFAYGLYVQASVAVKSSMMPTQEGVVWALRRLAGEV